MSDADANLFPVSTAFREAARVCCSIDVDKIEALLRERAVKVAAKATKERSAREFLSLTPEEKTKLQRIFGLEKSQVERVVSLLKYILEKASCHNLDSSRLKSFLLSAQCGLNETHAHVITQAWHLISNVRLAEDTIAEELNPSGPHLVDMEWGLHVNVAESGEYKGRQCVAFMSLLLEHPRVREGEGTSLAHVHAEPRKRVNVEFSRNELDQYFSDICNIQQQLDSHTIA